jgi:hypothetical protein
VLLRRNRMEVSVGPTGEVSQWWHLELGVVHASSNTTRGGGGGPE